MLTSGSFALVGILLYVAFRFELHRIEPAATIQCFNHHRPLRLYSSPVLGQFTAPMLAALS